MEQHKLNEALQIYKETLAVHKNVLGLNHKDTIETQLLMTHLYLHQENLLEPLNLRKAGLDARNAIFGFNNPRFTKLDEHLENF